ncbi:MAG: MBL fold metallo-hydrolase [Firmicutes bacterium]|nr:MBL fold metallo-hydrolase [Bacillota bacterium]
MSNRNNNRNNSSSRNNNSRNNNSRNKKQRRRRPFNKGIFAAKSIFFLVAVASVVAGWFFAGITIERFVNHNIYGNDMSRQLVAQGDEGLKVHFIDVGQGDAILVEFPDGARMLVDAGHRRSQSQFSQYLSANIFGGQTGRDRRIDYFVMTHSDADHIGNAVYVLTNYTVGTVFRPPSFSQAEYDRRLHRSERYYSYFASYSTVTVHPTVGWRETTERIYNLNYAENVRMNSAGLYVQRGGVTVTWLAPVTMHWTVSSVSSQRNNISTILLVEYRDRSVMLTGDATSATEGEALELSNFPSNIDVLQVGHHGSNSSSSPEFLRALTPTYAIISVGQNTYGHPTGRVLGNLKTHGGIESHQIYTTLQNGNIVAFVDSEKGNISIISGIANEDIALWVPYWGIFIPILVVIFGVLFTNDIMRLATIKKKR